MEVKAVIWRDSGPYNRLKLVPSILLQLLFHRLGGGGGLMETYRRDREWG
jgi:hypothetical protein